MLNAVVKALGELGLIGSGARVTYYINITTGDSMSISAFVDQQRFLQVKVSEFVDLERQFEVYCRAWSDYPDFVPRPLRCLERDGWSIMVCDGVLHTTVQRADVIRSEWRGAGVVAGQLCDYFQGSCNGNASAATRGQHALVGQLASHFGTGPLSRIASAVIADAIEAGVDSVPEVPQHGDFVLNNLGRAGKRLVVFDWEDYGKVSLAGLDILTLYASLIDHDVDALRRMMDTQVSPNRDDEAFVRRACEAQGLELTRFRRLLPFYLLVFLYLKRSYGAGVQDRIRALLQALCPRSESKPQVDLCNRVVSPAKARISGDAP